MSIEVAILETLAYSDIFDFPLTGDELHRFLVMRASRDDVEKCAAAMKNVNFKDGYYYLAGRAEIVDLRKRRETLSRKVFKRATFYGRVLGALPFVRMVTLTGSLALLNCDESGDYDYMIVARKGRVWLARAFALLLARFARLFGETLCPNLIISESALEWTSRNLYHAREICQMILISGEEMYGKFSSANQWIDTYFPNRINSIYYVYKPGNFIKFIQWMFEKTFDNLWGNRLEAWEMNRKIERFSRQAGFGVETQFNAEICQGNFDHHGMLTLEKYQKRLYEYKLESSNFPSEYLQNQAGYVIK
jgi:hypothetical protein